MAHVYRRSAATVVFTSGFEIPLRVRLGVGSLGQSRRALGSATAPPTRQDFVTTISPFIEDPIFVASVLVHELIHASLPPEEGHRRLFRAAAQRLELEGRMTQVCAGADLQKELRTIVRQAGPYPHKAIC